MQDTREIDYFGQRILQIVQPIAAGTDRREVLALLAQSVANNFAADGCWVLQYLSPGVVRVAASACVSHRTHSISSQLPHYEPPTAATPTQWKMPLLADYQVMVVETRDQEEVTGCLVLATKGVEWYRETKLVFQMVSEYVGAALIEEDLQVQAQISKIYPKLHYQLTQAIVENQPIARLFEIAVSDMVEALELKRGLVLTLKTSDLPKQHNTFQLPDANNTSSTTIQPPSESSLVRKTSTQVQIVTTIDSRKDRPTIPPTFLLEHSHLCQTALANAPKPTIFDGNDRTTSIDRLIFQDDRLPSIAMIPLMGATNPDRPPAEAVWGWLVLQHDRSRRWHPVELKLLQCQIYQIALARIQKRSLKQARTAVAIRTSQVQTSLQLQVKLHEAGRKQMEKLRQANELKDEFISTIGHELRTPLTSMSLAIKMLRQSGIDPDRRQQYLDILDEQCQREIKLINDLLKFQQLESKQLEFRPQQIALNPFISEQATFVADRWLDSKSLELSLHLPQVSPEIQTDADSLKHIVEELLINAGKFALPQTMVEVWLTIESERVIVLVSNLSKPISSEDLPNLFDRFRRGAGATKQAIAGTGLGLALVKSMVDHMRGTIAVTSNLVEGGIAKTCFTVTIPTVIEYH
ncbi:HAMP domain-containing sensor histidine kinase [Chamaesiphon sp. VAR_48_metabat_135_sub]|uniref:sensor histidine kinase n=1 Tax=Chamaesiphon sp. VAR_48_metabat_135_sub TaxID=2964699 RepID=UPI00286ACD18|nr:HAMP domain-containing sensor histidine kinase [Chamaesiphon sp. VAR_48_metabat_135_sub]